MEKKLLKILFVILCVSNFTSLQAQSFDYLALVGDGTTAGYNPYGTVDTRMEEESPGVWKWEGNLKGSGVFKIHTVEGDWCDGQWLGPANDGDALPETPSSYIMWTACEQDRKWDVPADGFYSITVDTNAGTIVAEGPLTYYLVGSATVGDWDLGSAREMKKDPSNPVIFTWEGNLDQNYEDGSFKDANFKILSVRTFDDGWDQIRASSPNADPLSSNSFVIEEGGTGNDDQWQINSSNRGSYRITLNLDTQAINFERLDYYPNLYLVGDATTKGWYPFSEDLKFTQDQTNPELFTYRGNFSPGSFRIHTYVGNWHWSDYIVPTAADQDISATDYEINRQGQGNDYNWSISEEGMYNITLDQAANTIDIILDTDGDGTKDSEDAFPEDPTEDTDTDNDGTGNNADTDDDGDGQSDEDELECGSDPLDASSVSTDTDEDGTLDCQDPDDDGDGTPDGEDAFPLDKNEDTDTDDDGTGNNADTDDDGDGQSDEDENTCGSDPLDASSVSTDTDGDGIPNCVDPDKDGDGVEDDEDAFPLDENEDTDTDGDDVGNNADTDDDGDGQTDEHETTCGSDPLDATSMSPDTDGDGIPDCVDSNDDTDTDGDGIPDVTDTDDDGDGQTDEHEIECNSDPLDASSKSVDTDEDGTPDCVDPDNDGDGTPDDEDAFPLDENEDTDTDNDGTGNNADTDDDGDGQSDEDENTCGSNPLDAGSVSTDTDEDGIPDCVDPDKDGDGVEDDEDAFPLDENEDTDTDGDEIGNNADTDDDGDGQKDEHEIECGSDPLVPASKSPDTDGDGIPDCVDSTDDTDTDSDGVPDVTDTDDDGDGQLDEHEIACGSDPLDASSVSTDTDNDGIPNCVDSDDDGDGVNDEEDAFPLDPSEDTDTDNDDIGNNADTDDDGDGQTDEDENTCESDPLDSASISTDTDGDGIPDCVDNDDDGDGVNDDEDAFPLDPSEDTDTDNDGIGNNADTDDDGDGQSDEDELACGSDPLDASSMATDTDGDGTPDCKEVTPYQYLALVGDATSAGWTPQGKLDTRMEMVSSGIWRWEGALKGSGVFKIHTVEGDWCDGQWLVPVNDGDVLPATTSSYDVSFGCEPNDYKWNVPADGFYAITVNTNTGTIVSEELSYHPNLYIIGSATVSDWSADLAREMTQDPSNPAIFTWEGILDQDYDGGFNDAEFKILSVRTFESGWDEIRATSANADPLASNSFVIEEGGTGNDYKWQINDSNRGSYKITLNLNTKAINFERLDYYPNLYLMGDATAKGWNPWSEELALIQDETNQELFTYRGEFVPGSFKIHSYVGDWNWGDYIVPTAADQNISATEYEINRQGQGNDYNWTISEAGIYTITLDQAANTINIILDTDGDGTEDSEDAFPEDPNEDTDTDGDGVGNNADTDDDGDGQTDEHELACGSDPLDASSKSPDTDGDGLPDCVDTENDTDTDGDGIPDVTDTDDDGDGQLDEHEIACGSDPLDASSKAPDTDGDGIPDCVDSNDGTDTDADGIPDVTDTDDDGDGQTEENELACGSDPLDASSTSVDTDGDGIPDCVDTDDDGDGANDDEDAFPLDPTEDTDTDNDGIGNNADTDDDGDGQSDEDELACGSDPLDASAISTDTDGDGTPDCKEESAYQYLALVGDATSAGWTPQGKPDTRMEMVSSGIWRWEGTLKGSGVFKIHTVEGDWCDGQWLVPVNDGDELPTTASSYDVTFGCEPNDYKWDVPEDGFYAITVNTNKGTIVSEELSYHPNLYIIGSATVSDWSADLAREMTQDPSNPAIFTWEGILDQDYEGGFNDAEFKILSVRTFESGWDEIRATSTNADPLNSDSFVIEEGGTGNDYKWQITTANRGSYKITLNLNNQAINFERLDYYPNLYLVGDATTKGWNPWSEELAFEQDDTNKELFTYRGEFIPGNFKIHTYVGDWNWGDYIVPTAADQNISATDYEINRQGQGNNYNWTISEAGMYTITLNQAANTINIILDTDGDGTEDSKDAFPEDPNEDTDTDNDGVGNNADPDDDGDGQTDEHETICGSDPLDATSTAPDTDNDGVPNCVDPDDSTDTDSDGIPDVTDPDDDNDGVPDENDAFPLDPTEDTDTDNDGIGNNADPDDDGDGVPDDEDAFPLDPSEDTDTDNDGTGDNADTDDDGDGQSDEHEVACGSDPLDPASKSPDTDGDGIPDCVDNDDDGDGVNDDEDAFPLDPTEDTDTDNDGIGNNEDTDDDGDGQSDKNELECGSDPLDATSMSVDTDGDGTPDCMDPDDDGDGVEDSQDECPDTEPGAQVSLNGCSIFSLPLNNYTVESTNTSCFGKVNGKIRVSAAAAGYKYIVSIPGHDPVSLPDAYSLDYTFTGLAAGTYPVCFTIEGQEDYQQCFEVTIDEPAAVMAYTEVDHISSTMKIQLDGPNKFYVSVNNTVQILEAGTHILPLKNGMNEVSVRGEQECQGEYFEKIFVSEAVRLYPNPSSGPVQIYIPGDDSNVNISVIGFNGAQVWKEQVSVSNSRVVEINLGNLEAATYILKITGEQTNDIIKVIIK